MSSISVSGKNWKYKNYNQEEINYLKDNYFLDEITSKLLSIRKIKRDEITRIIDLNKERTIDVIVTRLRKKIEETPKSPKYLQTIRGEGYVLWIE